MTWQKKVSQWQKLKPAERKARRWADVPRQVAASMALEGEPVDFDWLKTLHNRRTPRAFIETARGVLSYAQLAPLLAERLDMVENPYVGEGEKGEKNLPRDRTPIMVRL